MNNYVVNTTPDPKLEEVKEARFSYKMNKRQNFQGLPELPEEPNGEAENTGSSGDAKRNQNKLVADVIHQGDLKSNNDAYTLKTT